jgi:dihydrodipicolinate synthase/N-acetylneuraminate lyase
MPALISPFRRNGGIEIDAHRHNVSALGRRGVTGFLIGGSTGEGPYLEPGEREVLVAAARESAPHAFLLAGIHAPTLRTARSQTSEADAGGADAVLVSVPTALLRGRHSLVQGFFQDVAGSSPLPVFLYSFPQETGYEIPLEMVARLALHPNVAGMKDSGGHPGRMTDLVSAAPEGFFLYAGASAAVSLSVAAGATGSITASGNHLPELVAAIVARARRSARSAADAQASLTAAARAVEQFGIAGTKAAALLAGLRPGRVRRPLRELTRHQRRVVEQAWSAAVTDRTPRT